MRVRRAAGRRKGGVAMDVITVACNVCGRQKQETNHWIVAAIEPGAELGTIVFLSAGQAAHVQARNSDWRYEDLCGEACAHIRLSRWLDELKANSSITNGKDT